MDSFYDLFQNFWWLLFPLAFLPLAAFSSYLSYRKSKAKIDLLKAYAESGQEPPAALIAELELGDKEGEGSGSGRGTTTFLVILFAGLATVFAIVGYTGMMGVGEEFYLVSAILGVLALAFLFSGIAGGRSNKDDSSV